MNNREIKLMTDIIELGMELATLKGENKILKDQNKNLYKLLNK